MPDEPSSSKGPSTPSPVHGIKPPGTLQITGSIADNWKQWKQMWKNYSILTNLNQQTEEYKMALFLHSIGPEALKIYGGLPFADETESNTLSKIIEKFDEYTTGEINETYESYVFNSRNQAPHESIDAYVTSLRTLAKTCNCGTLESSLIRDRIVFGITNQQIRKQLLQERKLTLNKCIDLCRSAEATASQLKNISSHVDEIHQVKQSDRRRARKQNYDRNATSQTSGADIKNCKFCGGNHSPKRERCPAWGKECLKCKGKNHFAKLCTKSKFRAVRGVTDHESETSDSEIEFLAGIDVVTHEQINKITHYSKEIFAEMTLDRQPINFQIDCGASVNIIPENYVKVNEIKPTNKTLQMWNGTQERPRGTARLVLKNEKTQRKFSVEFVVVNQALTPLIGAKTAQQMGLITVHQENFITAPLPVRQRPVVTQVMTAEQLIEQYADVFQRELGTLPGTVHLHVDQDATPVISTLRRVETSLKEDLKVELDRLQELGVLASVDEPTPWVSGLAIVPKKSGALRICIDPRPLNEVLKRETYQLPILEDILPELSKAKVFSTVDLRSGYWHCVLDDESSLLTTFSTPYGRYRWRRLPFGLSTSSEIFQKRVNQALEGLNGVLNITDDILIYGVGTTEEEANRDHDSKLKALLNRCREKSIALNKAKLKLRLKEVKFMGHIFTIDGLKIDPDKAKAIIEMPRPDDVEGVQRLNGFVNYIAKFLPKLADVMEPIRHLTRKDVEWTWSEAQEKAFEEVKKLVTQAPVLMYYDPKSELEVQCDASQKGLGAALLQNGRPIAYSSRALTETEQRYAQIEKEMLAIVYALEKFNQYTFARHVKVQSDHKPLETILKKPLSCAPRRLQGMMMRLQKYDVTVRYERGTNMHIADMLSRAFLPTTEHPSGADFECINMAKFLPISDERLVHIRSATQKDEQLQTLKKIIIQGWPVERRQVPDEAKPYFNTKEELTIQDGVIFRGERVVIPHSLRPDMKQKAHGSHLGAESCLRRARDCIFWPGMSAEIKQMVAECSTCQKYQRNQSKETLMPHQPTSRPWEKIAVDLFTLKGTDYLVTVDYCSNFWEVDRMTDTRARAVILRLKSHFARYGCPVEVVSDNGPQFVAEEFAQFAKEWDFSHYTNSPHNSRANGKVESAVKTAKRILKKALDAGTDPYMAILEHRNTPSQDMGSSPAQRLMNRRTRTLLPTTSSLLQPRITPSEVEQANMRKRQELQALYYNRTAKDLPVLDEGDTVRIKPFRMGQKTWQEGVVLERLDQRSYRVESEDGGVYRRNRQHLRRAPVTQTSTKEPILPALQGEPKDINTNLHSDCQVPIQPNSHTSGEAPAERPHRNRRPPAHLQDYV